MFSSGINNSVVAYEPAPTVEESLCKEHALEMVQRIVMKLSPKLRSVIILKYIEDLSYSEIAELLGCSIGTVSSRLNRSHKILAEELKEFKHFL